MTREGIAQLRANRETEKAEAKTDRDRYRDDLAQLAALKRPLTPEEQAWRLVLEAAIGGEGQHDG